MHRYLPGPLSVCPPGRLRPHLGIVGFYPFSDRQAGKLGRVSTSAALPPPPRPTSGARLAWLDALRGLAAVAVLLEHLLSWFMPALRPYWFNLGMYGVLVFFLVSGYIIPVVAGGPG